MVGFFGASWMLTVTCLLLVGFFAEGFFLVVCLAGDMAAMVAWLLGSDWHTAMLRSRKKDVESIISSTSNDAEQQAIVEHADRSYLHVKANGAASLRFSCSWS
jgi:hypothetical protein